MNCERRRGRRPSTEGGCETDPADGGECKQIQSASMVVFLLNVAISILRYTKYSLGDSLIFEGGTLEKIQHDWRFVADIDGTISLKPKIWEKLLKKRLYTSTYSERMLFTNMALGKISLFRNYPALTPPAFRNAPFSGFSKKNQREFISVKYGARFRERKKRVSTLVDIWNGEKEIIGVTDYHFRETPLERSVNVDRLSYFNLLPLSRGDLSLQEMMTFVLSTPGYYTDSHSDDPDGSNHCIVGKKLWLAWDTFEGIENGLEDVERLEKNGKQAKFDLETFVNLKSARWFYVEDGETLFLPGNLTHKVYTLRKYVGFGSFYVSLPNYLRTMSRWLKHKPLWSLAAPEDERLLDDLADIAVRKLRALRKGDAKNRRRWGYTYLPQAAEHWRRKNPRDDIAHFMDDRRVKGFYDAVAS